MDLLITNASLPDGRSGIDLAASGGRWTNIGEGVGQGLRAAGAVKPGTLVIDAAGQLLSPPFVDAHFHMDATLSLGLPRLNESGTLLEGIALWSELKPHLTQDALIDRAMRYCDWAVARGLLAIRSHVGHLRSAPARGRGLAGSQAPRCAVS